MNKKAKISSIFLIVILRYFNTLNQYQYNANVRFVWSFFWKKIIILQYDQGKFPKKIKWFRVYFKKF